MHSIFDKLKQVEKEFSDSEFVAPIFTDKVLVNIGGIISVYRVIPSTFRGWGILKPCANKTAKVVNEASRSVKNKYLEILPKFNLVICDVEKRLGIVANTDNRIPLTQPLMFHLADNISVFDTIEVRLAGSCFIYDKHNRAANRVKGNLENQIKSMVSPEKNNFGKGYNEAYEYCFFNKQKELLGNKEYQVKSAIERAGGKYISYRNLNNKEINVSYSVNGKSYSSTIGDSLQVISAGICLDGGDRVFDLQSLLSVINEGQQKGLIYQY